MNWTELNRLGIERLVVFATVVEGGGFTAAAELLSISQPTVSFHIRELEKIVGGPLFVAPRRGVELTEIGARAFVYARAVMAGGREMLGQVRDIHAGQAGRLAVGASFAMGHYLLPKLLSEFQRDRPEAEISLTTASTSVIAEMVATERLAFAVGLESAVPPSLDTEFVLSDELILVCAPDHPLAQAKKALPAEIAQTPIVVDRSAAPHYMLTLRGLRAFGIHSFKIVAEIDGIAGIAAFVASGRSAAVVARHSVTREIAADMLRVVPMQSSPARVRYSLISRPRSTLTPLAQAFREFVQGRRI